MERRKEILLKMKQRRLRGITLQEAIEKSSILRMIISHHNYFAFWGH